MMKKGVYRTGLSVDEVTEVALNKSGLAYSKVAPRSQLLTSVKKVIGKPYKRGSSVMHDSPDFFDCSALASWAAVEAGFTIPRITIDQYVCLNKISEMELLPGDYVFVNTGQIIHTKGIFFSKVLGKEVTENPIRTETLEYKPGTKVPEGVDHVGIYMGEGKIVHSTSTKGGVVEENLKESASFQNIIGYGRVIEDERERFVVEIPSDRPDLCKKQNLINEINHIQ